MQIINQDYELVAVGELVPHPRNPRRGDTGVITDSIRHNGFYGAVVAQRSTGFILAGNHGDYRRKDGFYNDFVSRTIRCFGDAGAMLYNEAVFTVAGSLPLRVGKQFEGSRKLGKSHQNVLVFCKGNPKAATAAVGPVEIGFPE